MELSSSLIKNILTIQHSQGSTTYPELWSEAIAEMTNKAYQETLGEDKSFRLYSNTQRVSLRPYLKRILDGFSRLDDLYSGTDPLLKQLAIDLPKRVAIEYSTNPFPTPLISYQWIIDEHERWIGVDDAVQEVCMLYTTVTQVPSRKLQISFLCHISLCDGLNQDGLYFVNPSFIRTQCQVHLHIWQRYYMLHLTKCLTPSRYVFYYLTY